MNTTNEIENACFFIENRVYVYDEDKVRVSLEMNKNISLRSRETLTIIYQMILLSGNYEQKN